MYTYIIKMRRYFSETHQHFKCLKRMRQKLIRRGRGRKKERKGEREGERGRERKEGREGGREREGEDRESYSLVDKTPSIHHPQISQTSLKLEQ